MTDWCTLWPDLSYGEACCKPHDAAFDLGGSILDFLAANLDLGACVAAFGHSGIAVLMAIGTTAFGWIWWLRARWRQRLSKISTFPAAASGLFHAWRSTMFTNDDRRMIGEAARAYGLPEAHVLAVTEVESGGTVFETLNGRKEPLILNEPHIFFRRLSGAKREAAVAKGLAYSRQGEKPYPKKQADRWKWLALASAIDPDAALESCSWGCGQVMGMHWKRLGFASVSDFVEAARSGLKGQVDIMLRFVRDAGLADELAAGQWAPFARGYNGAGYRKNRYDEKLAAAAAKFGGVDDPANGMLRMGSTGRRVREVQELLVRSGAAVKVDGDFGPTTKQALQAFQQARDLAPDGIYGPTTETALSELRQASDDKPGKQKLLDIPLVKKGGAILTGGVVTATQLADAKSTVEEATARIVGLGIQSQLLDYAVSGLTIAGVGLGLAGGAAILFGWLHSKKTIEA